MQFLQECCQSTAAETARENLVPKNAAAIFAHLAVGDFCGILRAIDDDGDRCDAKQAALTCAFAMDGRFIVKHAFIIQDV